MDIILTFKSGRTETFSGVYNISLTGGHNFLIKCSEGLYLRSNVVKIESVYCLPEDYFHPLLDN